MTQLSLLDMSHLAGKTLRDAGMESVLEHTPEDWKEMLRFAVGRIPSGERFTMESVVISIGGRPSWIHPNAIGAMTQALAKKGIMKRTGDICKAKKASRHAADAVIWRRT